MFLLLVITTVNLFAQPIIGSVSPSCIPTSGLVAWYPFNGNANDSSGNALNGSVSGATLTTDRFGVANKAYSFNGTSDYIEIPYSSLFDNATFTISFWVKTPLSTGGGGPNVNQGILTRVATGGPSLSVGSSTPWLIFEIGGSVTYAASGIAGGAASGGSSGQTLYDISTDTWHHIAFTISTTVCSVYVDGTFITSNTYTVPVSYSSTVIRIGKSLNTYWRAFQGKVDDIAFYNRVLSSAEVTQLYTGGVSAGTISGSSTVCVGASTTLSDTTTGGTWSSSNTSIATIGSTGIVTGISSGTVTISYTVSNSCGTA